MKRNLIILLALMAMLALAVYPATAQTPGEVLVLTAQGPVSPVMSGYIERGIAAAEARQAELVVIKLNTPGGQIDITREIIQHIVNARVPVAVYVYPSGGFAASAGTFITLAGHVAAMAPQTSIGAASPVGSQGEDIGETMQAKVENILVADIENLAEHRGEAVVQWATEAITEAKAASASHALELGIIDVIADDLPDLLAQIDGMNVTVKNQPRTLHTKDAPITDFNMTIAEEIIAVILRPEIAFLLLAIGPLAIIYELSNPGGYISGVIGVICVVLGLYALGQLPINYAGAGLLALAFILFIFDVFAPTHGALTTAGVISLALGGLLLFNEQDLGYQVSLAPIVAVSVSVGAIFFFIIGKAIATLRMQPASGAHRLVGMEGIAKTSLDPEGIILADGTRWRAIAANDPIPDGTKVEIIAVDGLTVTVRAKQ